MKTNIYFVFQLFSDTDSVDRHTIVEIHQDGQDILLTLEIRAYRDIYECVLHVHRHCFLIGFDICYVNFNFHKFSFA